MPLEDLPPLRVYFLISSKEGDVTLSIDHTWSTEQLVLPLLPHNAIEEVLPLLEPAFAHYASQWQAIMIEDADETDSSGFWLASGTMPEHIALPERWGAIDDVVWRHLSEEMKKWLGYKREGFRAISTYDPGVQGHGNVDTVVTEPHEFGIILWDEH